MKPLSHKSSSTVFRRNAIRLSDNISIFTPNCNCWLINLIVLQTYYIARKFCGCKLCIRILLSLCVLKQCEWHEQCEQHEVNIVSTWELCSKPSHTQEYVNFNAGRSTAVTVQRRNSVVGHIPRKISASCSVFLHRTHLELLGFVFQSTLQRK